jgi:hypothetical protein
MTLNQIKYMVKVAEYGSINKVASMSFVSQSVISTAIKNQVFVKNPFEDNKC